LDVERDGGRPEEMLVHDDLDTAIRVEAPTTGALRAPKPAVMGMQWARPQPAVTTKEPLRRNGKHALRMCRLFRLPRNLALTVHASVD
jgi:hypothetical protein